MLERSKHATVKNARPPNDDQLFYARLIIDSVHDGLCTMDYA